MSSNSQEKNDSSSSDEEIRRRYESKNISGQKFDSEEDVIEISDSDSGQAIATNEKLMNTSSQVIISDYSSDDTLPLQTRTTDDCGSGNEDKPDLCQTIDLSQTQSTQDVLGTDSDSEIPPMLTRENAGIYQKPFTRPKEDASTSFQQQDKLQADEFPLLKFGPRTEEHYREIRQMLYSSPRRRIGPDSGYKKYLMGQREKEKEKEREKDDYGSGNEDKLDLCQTIDLSQTQSTQDVLGTDSDSEIPPMLTRENAGIYQKPFTRPKEDASTSFQQQDKLQADEFPLLKFGPRTEEHKREMRQMSAMIYSNPRRIGPDSGYKKAQRACDRDRYLRSQREKEREKKSERKSETESD